MRSSKIHASTRPIKKKIALLNHAIVKQQMHNPSKSPGTLGGRSIGIKSNQE
jgi:hypothetical protein